MKVVRDQRELEPHGFRLLGVPDESARRMLLRRECVAELGHPPPPPRPVARGTASAAPPPAGGPYPTSAPPRCSRVRSRANLPPPITRSAACPARSRSSRSEVTSQ